MAVADWCTGRLLVATPALVDDNFRRAVVLVLEHGPEGALGVILNRPTVTPVGLVADPYSEWASPPGVVHVGGPVQPDRAICLGRVDGSASAGGASALFGEVVSVDLGRPPEEAGVKEVRIFAGYSGWEGGQLEAELSAEGWFLINRADEDVFCSRPGALWHDVLRRQRPGRLAMLASYPADPGLN
jgi:putative transcriptional regulator